MIKHPIRQIAAAILVTKVGALPIFLLGGLAVQVRNEIGFSEGQLGFAVTVFFGVSAGVSAFAGRATERIGVRYAMFLAASITAAGLIGITLSISYIQLLWCLAIAAVGNAFAQPGANALLARSVNLRRQGLVFGLKQSAVPLSSMLGGAAVPVIGLTVGWRWAFALAVILCAATVALAPREERQPRARAVRSPETSSSTSEARRGTLPLLMLGALLGNMGSNSLGVFLVESLVQGHVAESQAGLMLVLASSSAIVVRVAGGVVADARAWKTLRPISLMLAVSVVGYLGVGWASGAPLLAFTIIAFAAGWGWNGLYALWVVRAFRKAPAAASGTAQAGLFLGAMAGPGLFGMAVDTLGFTWAWTAAGATSLLAAAVMLFVQHYVELPSTDLARP